MDIQQVFARVSELQQQVTPTISERAPTPASSFQAQLDAAAAAAANARLLSSPSAAGGDSLSALAAALAQPAAGLAAAGGGSLVPLATPASASASTSLGSTGSGGADALLAAAQREVGQRETSDNDGPAIARYRSAVQGAQPGDAWCAEFASYVASQAGVPLGASGEGFRLVSALTGWASQAGKLLGPAQTPKPGDLILYGSRHVGVVERVNADGTIDTIEGNESDQVERVHRHQGEWTGFVSI